MKVAGDVGRWKGDAKGPLRQWLSVLLIDGFEEALLQPPIVMRRLDLDGVVSCCWEVARNICSPARNISKGVDDMTPSSPFFSPLAVGLTHSSVGATSFFSFFSFSFFGAVEAVEGEATVFTAALASFSRRFASFLADKCLEHQCVTLQEICPAYRLSSTSRLARHLLDLLRVIR